MNSDDMITLMQKVEPLDPELEPWIVTNGPMGDYINAPLLQEMMWHDKKRCALINTRYRHKKEALAIAEARRDWPAYIWIHERPYRFEAMMRMFHDHGVKYENSAGIISSVWIDSENIWQHKDEWEEVWENAPVRNGGLRMVMEPSERTALRKQQDTLAIYRGVGEKGDHDGLSWTLDRKKAEWFAKRYGRGEPTVLRGCVSKERVYAYFTGRGESEIVVNPRLITARRAFRL